MEDGTWYGGEPIWVTAETQGMVAAAMLMVGTEADVGGVRSTFWTRYADRGTHRERVDQVLDWLALPPERRPHLVTLYFSAVDGAGHRTGPAAPAVAEAVEQVDAALGRLLDGIDALPHGGAVSVVLVSDHGMGAVRSGHGRSISSAVADLRGVRAVVSRTGRQPVRGRATRRGHGRCATTSTTESGAASPLDRRARLSPERGAGRAPLPRRARASATWWSSPTSGFMFDLGSAAAGRHARLGPAPSRTCTASSSRRDRTSGPASTSAPSTASHLYPFLARLLRLAPNPDVDGDLAALAPVLVPARQ